MVFARCLGSAESNFFFCTSAPSTRNYSNNNNNSSSYNSKRRSVTSSSRTSTTASTGIDMVGWTRKSSGSPQLDEDPAAFSMATTGSPPSPSPYKHHHHHPHKPNHHSQGNQANGNGNGNGVVFRRGDKSFLDFHQNYAITRHLGEGSYSTVKQVTHRKRGGLYACKIVDKTALSPVDRVALSQEVKVLASVHHDHIMRLYEVIEDDAKCYLIMELAENGDLFDKIVKQGKFPQPEAQKVTAALCEALDYCHSNAIIHRDVKPENVLLSSDPHCIKLCDFGFAKQLSDATEKSVDSCGTPGYAAPEILDGKPYGVEVDVFSLGVVTYIMLCGYPPFPMKLSQLRTHRFNVRFPSKDWASVDPSVKELITKMLHIKPELRPKTSELKLHPWIMEGKQIVDKTRHEAESRQREEAMQRKQVVADTIRKKLTSTTGFEVVKHGRQGQPHRTKLRLSTDGKVLSWQPKLLKRGLLKYHQNAKSLTSFFGFGSSSSTPSKKAQVVTHPQIARLSSLDSAPSTGGTPPHAEGGRHSEPILCDDSERSAIFGSLHPNEQLQLQRQQQLPTASSQQQLSKASSTSSTTSTGSSSWIDKTWWKSFRRTTGAAKVATSTAGGDQQAAARSASGGVAFAAFSLNKARSLSSSSSSCSAVSDSYETATQDSGEHSGSAATSSRISFSSSSTSEPVASPGISPRMATLAQPMSPSNSDRGCSSGPTAAMLDSSVHLRDIRAISMGEDSPFFQTLCGIADCEKSCCRQEEDAVRSTAKTTTTTETTDSSSSFDVDDVDDSHAKNKSKKKRPVSTSSASSSSSSSSSSPPSSATTGEPLNATTTLTVATRFRELHLEFPSQEIRDAFAFLLEQATLPLEEVGRHKPQQHGFLYRAATAEPMQMKATSSTNDPAKQNKQLHEQNNETYHNV